eukprot:86084-Rhodomonas_salina.1
MATAAARCSGRECFRDCQHARTKPTKRPCAAQLPQDQNHAFLSLNSRRRRGATFVLSLPRAESHGTEPEPERLCGWPHDS